MIKFILTLLMLLVHPEFNHGFIPRISNACRTTTPTSSFLKFGPSESEHMNAYNLNLEDSVEKWTAKISAASSMTEEGIFLNTNDDTNYFVDTLKFDIERSIDNPSLGLSLMEVAGGRGDGIGITLIDGIIPDGNADKDTILIVPGDSISQIDVITSKTSGMDVSENILSLATECLDYDATVEAIQSLPSPSSKEPQRISMTIKRIRRKPKIKLNLQYPPYQNEPDETITLFSGENLRRALLTRGVKLNDKFSERFDSGGIGDCGAEGTCATCAVSVTNGMELLSPISIQEEQILRKHPRWRFACKAVVGHGMTEGEITMKVNPRQWKLEA